MFNMAVACCDRWADGGPRRADPRARRRPGAPLLFAEHPYARRQVEAGQRLHGGFDADGRYISPQTLVRH